MARRRRRTGRTTPARRKEMRRITRNSKRREDNELKNKLLFLQEYEKICKKYKCFLEGLVYSRKVYIESYKNQRKTLYDEPFDEYIKSIKNDIIERSNRYG